MGREARGILKPGPLASSARHLSSLPGALDSVATAAALGHGGGAGHLSGFAGTCCAAVRGPALGLSGCWARLPEEGRRARPARPVPRPALPVSVLRPRCVCWGVGGVLEPWRPSAPHRRGLRARAGLELAAKLGHGPRLASPRDRFVRIPCVCGDGFPPWARVPIRAVRSDPGQGRGFSSFLGAVLACLLLTRNLRLFG